MQLIPHRFGAGFRDFAYVGTGDSRAVQADGSLCSWNENLSDTPFVLEKAGDGFQIVATTCTATSGIKKNGELWAWDHNAPSRAQAGGDDAPVLLGQGYASLSVRAYYVMALETDGTLWAT
jgi:hypothetical protein